jgi:hypothetical protein
MRQCCRFQSRNGSHGARVVSIPCFDGSAVARTPCSTRKWSGFVEHNGESPGRRHFGAATLHGVVMNDEWCARIIVMNRAARCREVSRSHTRARGASCGRGRVGRRRHRCAPLVAAASRGAGLAARAWCRAKRCEPGSQGMDRLPANCMEQRRRLRKPASDVGGDRGPRWLRHRQAPRTGRTVCRGRPCRRPPSRVRPVPGTDDRTGPYGSHPAARPQWHALCSTRRGIRSLPKLKKTNRESRVLREFVVLSFLAGRRHAGSRR